MSAQYFHVARLGLSLASILMALPAWAGHRIESEERIVSDKGGYVASYVARLVTLREEGRKVAFAGECDSACTLFLALPRNQVCISPGAFFGFHAPSAPTASGAEAAGAFMLNQYPNWVRRWIAEQGGLSARLTLMDYSYASQHIDPCR